jgi:hypothetical protein
VDLFSSTDSLISEEPGPIDAVPGRSLAGFPNTDAQSLALIPSDAVTAAVDRALEQGVGRQTAISPTNQSSKVRQLDELNLITIAHVGEREDLDGLDLYNPNTSSQRDTERGWDDLAEEVFAEFIDELWEQV